MSEVLCRVAFGAQLFWFLVMLASAIGKIVEFGMYSYVLHFTNTMWTLCIIFFGGTLSLSDLSSSSPHWLARKLQRWLYCPLLGIIAGIFVGVTVLLGSGSRFLSSLLREVPAAVLILGNETFHTYPLLAIVLYGFVHAKQLALALRPPRGIVADDGDAAETDSVDVMAQWLFFIYQLFGGSMLALVVYLLCVDVQAVYDTHIDALFGLAMFSFTALAINAVPIYWSALRSKR